MHPLGPACLSIAGKEIGRELHATRVEPDGAGETFDEFGFPQTGQALEEQMPAREHAGDDEFDQFLLPEQDRAQRGDESFEGGGSVGEFSFVESDRDRILGKGHTGNFGAVAPAQLS